MLKKIISGGQTGVDRAALDVALQLGLPCGGWCPKGRRAEDGPISLRYPLTETPSENYEQRTEWNVRDSDGTLILSINREISGGTAYTKECARRLNKPFLVIDLLEPLEASTVQAWLKTYDIHSLNVAGPREEKSPGIYARAFDCLLALFTALRE